MELKKWVSSLSRTLAGLEKARDDWDFAAFQKFATALRENMRQISGCWEAEISRLEKELSERREHIRTPEYQGQLEDALRGANLPLKGEFPKYDVGPFRLVLDIKALSARLVFARRTEKTSGLAPAAIAKWVEKRYRNRVGRPFNANQFADDLLAAYEVANQLAFNRQKVWWGQPIPLRKLYKLLTLRRSGRTEYPEAHFIFDLTRFRKTDLVFNGRRFGFGTSRDVGQTFLLRDENGREERLSSLTIYDRGE